MFYDPFGLFTMSPAAAAHLANQARNAEAQAARNAAMNAAGNTHMAAQARAAQNAAAQTARNAAMNAAGNAHMAAQASVTPMPSAPPLLQNIPQYSSQSFSARNDAILSWAQHHHAVSGPQVGFERGRRVGWMDCSHR